MALIALKCILQLSVFIAVQAHFQCTVLSCDNYIITSANQAYGARDAQMLSSSITKIAIDSFSHFVELYFHQCRIFLMSRA